MTGDGMWIWYLSQSQHGNVRKIVAKAHRRGVEVLYIKGGDGGGTWSQFTPSLVSALKAHGLRVCAWQYVYGDRPKAEAAVGAELVARGADCLVIDAEGSYEGEYAKASTYMYKLRQAIGPDFPLALSSFPYVDYHPAFPYSVFLGPGGAQYNLPQVYWKTIGTKVDTTFVHTYVFNRAYDRAILPVGQVYLKPKSRQVRRFRRLAKAHHMGGISWWSWQEAGRRQWKAIGARVKPLPGYRTYDSFPFLHKGSSGDLVAWAQQLLVGGGYETPITGYFTASTRSAVLDLQSARGLELTGAIDVPTWNVLIGFDAAPVRWTKDGAVRTRSVGRGGGTLREPRSARLPALGYEIPAAGGSDG